MDERKVIELSSFFHYSVRRTLHGLEIIEYPADDCPAMGGEMDRSCGRPIAVLGDDEEANFILGRFTAALPSDVLGEHRCKHEEIWCGDDFIQYIRGNRRKRNE